MKICVPVLIMAVALALALPAFSQEDMKVIASDAYSTLTRPPAVFVHDEHNEKAGVEDCVLCHHGGSDGVQDTSMSTEGIPCSDCHDVKPASNMTGLTNAYHGQCIGCHREQGKGPLACSQCHVR